MITVSDKVAPIVMQELKKARELCLYLDNHIKFDMKETSLANAQEIEGCIRTVINLLEREGELR